MADRVDRNNMWARMQRNFIKWWRVFYIPIQRFAQKGSKAVDREEYIEQQQEEMRAKQAEMEAARERAIDQLTIKAEEGVAAKQMQQSAPSQPEVEEEVDLLTADDSSLSADELTAKEILARLAAEAAADAAAKQAEIDAARAEAEASEDSAYNATTKSFSGNYGKGPMDDATKDAVAGILNQNNNDLSAMIANIQNEQN